jgi:pyridoxine 5-phosphate synthase
MAVTPAMVDIAKKIKPAFCCFVPERREEITTEGGLDVIAHEKIIAQACAVLAEAGIKVSLFIDPEPKQIEAAVRCGAPLIEIHTGEYADAKENIHGLNALQRIQTAAALASEAGLCVNAGHGLHYHNVAAIAAIPMMHELNIGHAIVARALFTGMRKAVGEMKKIINTCKKSP